MKMASHVVASTIAGTAVYGLTGSTPMAVSLLLSGVLIDLDHLVDYFALSGEKFSLSRFFSWFYEKKWKRIYVILHSYEFYILLVLGAYWSENDLLLGATMGVGLHMVMDQIGNRQIMKDTRLSPWFYFLAFRYRAHFEKKRLLDHTNLKDY